MQLNKEAVATL